MRNKFRLVYSTNRGIKKEVEGWHSLINDSTIPTIPFVSRTLSIEIESNSGVWVCL